MNALQQLDGIFATNKQNPVLLVLYETYCYLKGDFSLENEIMYLNQNQVKTSTA